MIMKETKEIAEDALATLIQRNEEFTKVTVECTWTGPRGTTKIVLGKKRNADGSFDDWSGETVEVAELDKK